ncbi:MAG: nucleotidyltransferase domain-containing protein [Armatimonadetes bacterium]|nr:nucleotidyltransferase domain-containing protein [Armatimonadota bacterium]PIU60251.1 MAG: DNA polymerase subunit beta [Armatimonadetes bacterium CG07_land_8_20_14_0_80_59_28]PIX41451.1 MAG: DNA polymerase subunit beta [Armatimonadetes bacterium CG_4_8_14_3_um_filter_58_9]
MTETRLREIAEEYRDALEGSGISVTAIYLFGSCARGDERDGSDVDFCVVSDALGDDDFEDMVRLNQIAKRVAPELEVFPVSGVEFRQEVNPFLLEAKRYGKRLI